MKVTREQPAKSSSPGPSRRRVWTMRILAILLPLILVGILELVFRIAGLYADDYWDNHLVAFEKGGEFFPNWDREIAMPKPARTRRIFVLGGSAAEGFGVEEPFGVLLQKRLAAKSPDRQWEVINGGVSAFGSHRVYEVLKRACQFQPDLIVVYLGHNEFLEEIFFDPSGFVAKTVRWGRLGRQCRVVNWLRSIVWGEGKPRPILPRQFVDNQNLKSLLRLSTEQYGTRLRFLASNMNQMIDYCQARAVPVVFVPEVSNLLSRPGYSLHGPGYAAKAAQWDDLFARTQSKMEVLLAADEDSPTRAREADDAIALTKALNAIDGDYALTHFWSGQALLEKGDTKAAREELVLALLHDKWAHRANRDVVETIAGVCRQREILLLDVSERFYSRLQEQYLHYRRNRERVLFLDHCHPTQEGHAIIADELLQFLARNRLLDPHEPGRTLPSQHEYRRRAIRPNRDETAGCEPTGGPVAGAGHRALVIPSGPAGRRGRKT